MLQADHKPLIKSTTTVAPKAYNSTYLQLPWFT